MARNGKGTVGPVGPVGDSVGSGILESRFAATPLHTKFWSHKVACEGAANTTWTGEIAKGQGEGTSHDMSLSIYIYKNLQESSKFIDCHGCINWKMRRGFVRDTS